MTATVIMVRLPTRRSVSIPRLGFTSAMQCVVLYEPLADIEKPDDLIFEGRSRRIITEPDIGARVDGIQCTQRIRLITAVQVEQIDAVIQPVVAQISDTIAQGGRAENRH